jgi:hypothetical protein
MTDVWVSLATIQDVKYHTFTVDHGRREYVKWPIFCEWVGDPVEAMHILRRQFAGYSQACLLGL